MKNHSWCTWGMSTKEDGQMKGTDALLPNREKFLAAVGLDARNSVAAELIHGDTIRVVDREHVGQIMENTDGLITSIPGVILTVTVADCLPVYFFDAQKRVIGLVHAGWRGVAKDIVPKTVQKMTSEFGTNPHDIEVIIGPHIKDCHFEVMEDVAEHFAEYRDYIVINNNKINNNTMTLNLSGVVREQLQKESVKAENIHVSDECTYCLDTKYYSFRRDKPEKVQAMMAYVVMKG